ncbi:hypothetical protein B0H15DRAFT_858239 [Mycena belliarum]|uniref:Uncharacterized protein n=1 Tax=Mycena belliarum TaxID=1033014 RepID=A0AAD6XJQ3_9AGAR|nr:hypothetical protein B0H15DRAFT_858239 [Mycena belliae]
MLPILRSSFSFRLFSFRLFLSRLFLSLLFSWTVFAFVIRIHPGLISRSWASGALRSCIMPRPDAINASAPSFVLRPSSFGDVFFWAAVASCVR